MARGRRRYSAQDRLQAGDLYIHQGLSMREISEQMDVPMGTLGKWSTEDDWVLELRKGQKDDEGGYSFGKTCQYIMRTIHRMSRRLFESTIAVSGDEEDDSFIMPDENLELRLNRLTLALERIMPMGNMLRTRQRIDVVQEIKKIGFESVERGMFTDNEMMTCFRLLSLYLDDMQKESQ